MPGERCVAVAGAAALLLLAGCGDAPASPEAAATQTSSSAGSSAGYPTSTGTTVTTTPPPDATSGPPLSSIPPPTLDRPTGPPSEPSDRVRPITLTGSATRHPTGCLVLKTDVGDFELVGAEADKALAHPKVTVVAVAQPAARSACEYTVMRVWSVTAAT